MDRRIAVPLLKRVKQEILKHPSNYNQFDYLRCIIAKMNRLKICPVRWVGRSDRLKMIGLGDDEYCALYFIGRWPKKFIKQYLAAKTPRGRAGAAGRRIDHFIAVGK